MEAKQERGPGDADWALAERCAGGVRVARGSWVAGAVVALGGQSLPPDLPSDQLLALLLSNPGGCLEIEERAIDIDAEGLQDAEDESRAEMDQSCRVSKRILPDGRLGVDMQPCSVLPLGLSGSGGLEVVSSRCPMLSPGDIVVAVNGIQLLQLEPTVAAGIFAHAKSRMVIVVSAPLPRTPVRSERDYMSHAAPMPLSRSDPRASPAADSKVGKHSAPATSNDEEKAEDDNEYDDEDGGHRRKEAWLSLRRRVLARKRPRSVATTPAEPLFASRSATSTPFADPSTEHVH